MMLGIISKKDNKNNNDDFQEENISSIKFIKRKLRYRTLALLKALIFIFITVSISIVVLII
ncbi:hypothetical protein, partial [uncultured Clostridium sp.]|uniref:hypothetical protein n=1 Tax=uncultured Clostridium sp. TaxID=59620 RepID=UPI0025F86B67